MLATAVQLLQYANASIKESASSKRHQNKSRTNGKAEGQSGNFVRGSSAASNIDSDFVNNHTVSCPDVVEIEKNSGGQATLVSASKRARRSEAFALKRTRRKSAMQRFEANHLAPRSRTRTRATHLEFYGLKQISKLACRCWSPLRTMVMTNREPASRSSRVLERPVRRFDR